MSALLQGTFVYRGRPLAEVIEDIQRYTARRISIDPEAADIKFSGLVRQHDVDEWLRGLPEIYPDLVIEDHARTILIRSRSSPGPGEVQAAVR
jgi:ferric-dicitrate binding protein FerR (iron transport regulator)